MGGQTAAVAADVAQLLTMGLMAACGLFAATRLKGNQRLGAFLVGLTGASWTLGQLLWVAVMYAGAAPFDGPWGRTSALLFLVGTPMLLAATMTLVGQGISRTGLYRRVIDVALVVGSILIVLWGLYLGGVARQLVDADPISIGYAFVYPVGDAIILGLLVALYPGLAPHLRRPLAPLAAGLVLLAVADVSFAYAQSDGNYYAGSHVVLGWAAGEVLLATCMVWLAINRETPFRRPERVGKYSAWVLAAPAAAMAFLAVLYVRAGSLDGFILFVALGVFAALLVRHVLHGRELNLAASQRERGLRDGAELTAQRRANENLRQLDEFKTNLLNMAAHELNTPLAALRLQVYVLRGSMGPLNERSTEALNLMDRNVERMGRLVADTLDVARIQSGNLKLDPQPSDIPALVSEAVETLEPLAQERKLRIVSQVRAGLRAVVDPRRLSQVVFNLVSNAIKFTPVGGEIRIRANEEAGHLLLSVSDTGIGLSPAQTARLFRPFVQVHDSRRTATKGTGLGLFISRSIVEQHGGHLDVTSPGAGLGSTFSLDLPMGVPA